jgi:hypothetical protein
VDVEVEVVPVVEPVAVDVVVVVENTPFELEPQPAASAAPATANVAKGRRSDIVISIDRGGAARASAGGARSRRG